MTILTHQQRQLELKPWETVLDCLLRHGVALPYACKAGMCQACIVRAVDCSASEESRKWVRPELQALGYTLACQWVPDANVQAELPVLADFAVRSTIRSLQRLNDDVLQVLLEITDPRRMFAYRPGQYLTAINGTGTARAYSIANDFNEDGCVELHIAATTHGEFTRWLFDTASAGDTLYVSGPAGHCHYDVRDDADAALILAGTGTGLSPLYGIVMDALRQQHTESIHLYHAGRTPAQLYLVDTLRALASKHDNFHYHPCAVEDDGKAGAIKTGRLEQILAHDLNRPNLAQSRIFLSGAPTFVHAARKKLYLLGARSEHIHCDPFTERVVVTV